MGEKWKSIPTNEAEQIEKNVYIGEGKELGFDQEELQPEARDKQNKPKKGVYDDSFNPGVINSTDVEDAVTISIKSREAFIKKYLQLKELDEKFSGDFKKIDQIKNLQKEIRKIDEDIETIEEHVKLLVKGGENRQEDIDEGNRFIKLLKIKRSNKNEELNGLREEMTKLS